MDITREEIESCEHELLNAMLHANVEVMDSLIHDDLLFNAATGMVATKQMDLDTYRSGLMKINTLKPQDQQIKITGDTATVSVTIGMDAEFSGQKIGGSLLFLRVWKKTNGRIQLIAGSSVAL